MALIPARGGSKAIPQKALQPVGGTPLILRTVETVRASGVADRIVVSTDCPQIRGFCELRGIEVIDRPADLAGDDMPLAPVIDHAASVLGWHGEMAVFQPTCPLLRPATVRRVVDEFRGRDAAWAITGTADPHIFWRDGQPLVPRVNRQQLNGSALLRESGAIQLRNPRGRGDAVIAIDAAEAYDIDTPADLEAAARQLDAAVIRFTVAASDRVGSGHYWRCLQIADRLTVAGHAVQWEWAQPALVPEWAAATVSARAYAGGGGADLCIYDMLDAGRRVLEDRAAGSKVVVFEDHGPAAGWADLAIDEMTDGPKWAVLRPEFHCLPAHRVGKQARRVLVTFGGTDPSNLAGRVTRLLDGNPPLEVRQISPGMNAHMAQEMLSADLVITGQGRTVFEAAACGVPCMSIAANEREARHVRIPGVIYAGLHTLISDSQIAEAVLRVLNDQPLREEMSATSRAQIDGKGLDRIVHAIAGLLKGL